MGVSEWFHNGQRPSRRAVEKMSSRDAMKGRKGKEVQQRKAIGMSLRRAKDADLTQPIPVSKTMCDEAASLADLPSVPRKRKRMDPSSVAKHSEQTSPSNISPSGADLSRSAFAPALEPPEELLPSRTLGFEEGLSVDQTSRLRERVLAYVKESVRSRDFVGSLRDLIRIDPDCKEDVQELEVYVSSVVASLFQYRQHCADRDRDGKDKTLLHGIVLSGKGGEGRKVYLSLKDDFGLKANFTRFVSKQKNARNQLLQRFGCFKKDSSINRMHFPPLLPNEELLKIPAFRDAPFETLDTREMAKAGHRVSLMSSLRENPYDFPRRLPTFRMRSIQALNTAAEYIQFWLFFLQDELRGEVHESLTKYLPEIESRWRIRCNRLVEPEKDIAFLMKVEYFVSHPEGHEEVVLRPAFANSEYFAEGRRALHQDDVVVMRFVKTDGGKGSERFIEEDEENRTVLGFVEKAPRTHYEDKWKVLFFCPRTFGDPEELPRKVELQILTAITPMRRMFEAVQESAFISKRLLQTLLSPEKTYSAFRDLDEYGSITSFTFRTYAKEFNPEQLEFCKQLVNQCIPDASRLSRSGFFCVQGPPGTGKSTAIISAINLIIRPPYSRRVLLCAPSNTAVDLLLERIKDGIATAELNRNGHFDMVRRSPQVVRLSTARCSEKIRSTSLEEIARERAEFREYAGQNVDKEAEVRRAVAREKFSILRDESIKLFCGTLGCLGQDILKRSELGFDVVIVDEAGQCTEPEVLQALVPLSRSRKVPDVCVLVGDPHQLPATLRHVESTKERQLLGRSLLQRFMDCRTHRQKDCIRLRLQYRMHPSISRFSAKYIYSGDLQDSQFVFKKALFRKPYHFDAFGRFGPVTVIDMRNCRSVESERDFSKYNIGEVEVVMHLLRTFHLLHQKDLKEQLKIAVITPYREQVAIVKSRVREEKDLKDMFLMCSTVDGVQGDEVDVVIISTVRSNLRGNIGFVADPRRMNVALTRARYSLIMIGDSNTLEVEEIWGTLLSEVKSRSPVDNFYIEMEKGRASLKKLFPELYTATEIPWT